MPMLNSYQSSLPKLVVPSVAETMKRVSITMLFRNKREKWAASNKLCGTAQLISGDFFLQQKDAAQLQKKELL